jgi:hypothetical protein
MDWMSPLMNCTQQATKNLGLGTGSTYCVDAHVLLAGAAYGRAEDVALD